MNARARTNVRVTLASCEQVAGAVVVHCAGQVDMSNADELLDSIASTTAADVIVDLGELRYLDSSGIRAVEQAYRRARSSNRSFLIVAPPGSVAEWTWRVAACNPNLLSPTIEAALASIHGDE